ncbi:MAG: hypothetical protein ABIZ70_09070 [Gemmatimonadales bacterium]
MNSLGWLDFGAEEQRETITLFEQRGGLDTRGYSPRNTLSTSL